VAVGLVTMLEAVVDGAEVTVPLRDDGDSTRLPAPSVAEAQDVALAAAATTASHGRRRRGPDMHVIFSCRGAAPKV
jgi:hypothetical protein